MLLRTLTLKLVPTVPFMLSLSPPPGTFCFFPYQHILLLNRQALMPFPFLLSYLFLLLRVPSSSCHSDNLLLILPHSRYSPDSAHKGSPLLPLGFPSTLQALLGCCLLDSFMGVSVAPSTMQAQGRPSLCFSSVQHAHV